ncbi:MAG TPA: hypothetical protein VMF11_02620 [Candidatus Baltobacteraceae bacterium]|nr:hypothetical protein [Candidatus Baltobacteraceae bacterium]
MIEPPTAEHARMFEHSSRHNWRQWGPYVSDRQWGTVREDYSATGEAWDYFPFDIAGQRVYRWGEDGIFGISDLHQHLCFALAMWNGNDDRLKERLFGLSGTQGNHGEDVKEYYYYLDNLPSHAYMRALYKYPHAAFPYRDLIDENGRRSRAQPEYELIDTGIFDANAYFDVEIEYAKSDFDDILIRVRATNRGSAEHTLHLLPTLWFRNEWSWREGIERSSIELRHHVHGIHACVAHQANLGDYWFYAKEAAELLFTENETNFEHLYGISNRTPHVKDGIERAIVHGERSAVSASARGTKVSAHYPITLAPDESRTLELRLSANPHDPPFGEEFDALFSTRIEEADAFYEEINPFHADVEARRVQRQAFAGLLWTKQFYHYNVPRWLTGDPLQPPPPPERLHGRNHDWIHFDSAEVMSMPDKWEYPWFAAWDLAFHTVAFALIDPAFAKGQLILLAREWFMHPNGQLPAYEWAFADVNPPVHAWAALRIYQIEQKEHGRGDIAFLERVFQKLLLNFTWWVNRKDAQGNNVFQGGFLGLDNIGVFDRSKPLPAGGFLNQSDGTSWMGVYTLNMLAIALELAMHENVYEDIAIKFFEHFLYIADAINHLGGHGLWNHEDGFYYDMLMLGDGTQIPMRIHSMVGLLPLLAVEIIEPEDFNSLPEFKRRVEWFITHRPELARNVASITEPGMGERRLLAIVGRDRLVRILSAMLDESKFLSPHGLRALSRYHKEHPFVLRLDGQEYSVDYEPAESTSGLFGGNSNWRGPIWYPLNFLLVEALQRFHYYYGSTLKVEAPTGSGTMLDLWEVGAMLSGRLINIFLPDAQGHRPVFGGVEKFNADPHWRDNLLFYEYFNGDDGAGLGASHQTGWTALVAKLIEQRSEYG